ncbi:hypothetical protein RhiirA1_481895, partial [Rhizophagus irregularis]
MGTAPIGQGTGPGLTSRNIGAKVGTETVTLLTSQMPAHSHTPVAIENPGTSGDPSDRLWAEGVTGRGKVPEPLYHPNVNADMNPQTIGGTVALVIASFVSTPAINVKAGSTGTSDGVYDFSGPLGDIDSETGLVEFGDKFLIKDGFEVDGTQLYSLNGEAGATETLIIKAEGGDICKTFTFKDLGISLYTGISSTEITLTLVIKNAYGETIGTHTTSNGKKIAGDGSDKVVYQLSNLLDHDGQFNYNGVASLEITYQLGKDYYNTIRLPMDLNFENITIANVSADDIPPFIPDGVINATN